jgi:hypothetical protein
MAEHVQKSRKFRRAEDYYHIGRKWHGAMIMPGARLRKGHLGEGEDSVEASRRNNVDVAMDRREAQDGTWTRVFCFGPPKRCGGTLPR